MCLGRVPESYIPAEPKPKLAAQSAARHMHFQSLREIVIAVLNQRLMYQHASAALMGPMADTDAAVVSSLISVCALTVELSPCLRKASRIFRRPALGDLLGDLLVAMASATSQKVYRRSTEDER